jgi:hypothetical protein
VIQDRAFESDFDKEVKKDDGQGKEKIMQDARIDFKEI